MSTCYCGSGKEYSDCCEPIINGSAKAPTAEALMRARYSAHCAGAYEFLETSSHPDLRDEASADEIREWSKNMHWDGLEIISTEKGGEGDIKGVVDFEARYTMRGVPQHLRETSFFCRADNTENGDWVYVDGTVHSQTVHRDAPKVGRNEPCPCGSGKKYKKCCGK